MDDNNQKEKTNLEFDAESGGDIQGNGNMSGERELAEESLGSVVNKMRGLGLFDGVDDPYAELMRERGVEIDK